jgi:DNA-binding NarL/FixJ family response regulator
MDINLPDVTGIDLCKQVKEKYPEVFIIGLSTFNQLSFIEKMMENGASGYVLKNATKDELLEAITLVSKGKTYLSFEASKTVQHKPADEIVITRREKEVLKLIADGMTNNAIAQTLYISTATVDTHRKNLLSKFDAKNTALLIRIATQMGMI